jgi:predicted regulator of Ras-like GTPase activity (Roadblock/LC7/MglB family)
MTLTTFTPILQAVVDRVDGAVGAIFAAWDGEAVDLVYTVDKTEMALLAAHYGVILSHVQSAIKLFHFGEAYEIVLLHDDMDLLVRTVADGYYVIIAVRGRAHLATAVREIARAAEALRQEMTW